MERRPHQFWHRGAWTVRIHGPAFRYPRGWHARRWAVGAVLPALFLTSDYYYDGYGTVGLQSPPPGYRWVRYGDDLLLVNLRTGAVEDVVEDVFE
jgi:Ni/Co efflux regulator RcnB